MDGGWLVHQNFWKAIMACYLHLNKNNIQVYTVLQVLINVPIWKVIMVLGGSLLEREK